MKKFKASLLVIFLYVFFCQAAGAQDGRSPLVPLPSLDDFTNGDGWGFGLGLGVEYEPAYEGSDEYGFEVDPAGAAQWRSGDNIFFFSGQALGWRGLRADSWLLQAAVGYEEGREEGDSDDGRLDGLGDAESGAVLLLEARRALDADWRYWLDGRVLIGDNDIGRLGVFGAGRRFGNQNDGSGSELGIVLVFHDSNYANRDFGINAEQAAASMLDETELDGGFRSFGINYNYRLNISSNWQLFGEVLYERYSSEIKDSPISREDFELEIGTGIIYVF